MPANSPRVAIMLDMQWPYKRHAEVFAGTQRYASEQGWNSIIDEFAHDTLAARRAGSVPYDGIIARASVALFKQAARLRVPLVNVWANSPVHEKLPSVYPDFAAAGKQSAEHLLGRGLRHFATLTPPRSVAQDWAVNAFVREVKQAGFSCDTLKVPQDPWRNVANWRKIESKVESLCDNWRTSVGVYVSENAVARILAQSCRRRGLRVPQDVAIIVSFNEEVLCEHPRPTITAVEFGYERVGYEAAQLLDSLMEGEKPPDGPVLLPSVGLVVRESTDFHAINDELVAAALAYISANSHRSIGQHDVARAVSVGTRTLQNRFREHLGRPVVAEIRRVRIERAKRELVQGKRPIAAIARDCGFGKSLRMYEVFRRELGVSPSEYRKQRRMESL